MNDPAKYDRAKSPLPIFLYVEPSSVNSHLPDVLFQRISLEVCTTPEPLVVRTTRTPPSPAVTLLPVLKSIWLSATESVAVLTVVWVPLTVRSPPIIVLPVRVVTPATLRLRVIFKSVETPAMISFQVVAPVTFNVPTVATPVVLIMLPPPDIF